MTSRPRQFLFGRPVLPAKPMATGQCDLFILGAYPSALHVRWHVPEHNLSVQAVAVDNEPEPFWTGEDEEQQFENWRKTVSFQDKWGEVKPCGRLNGSSGIWVQKRILNVLKVPRARTWITDCLDTYHESKGATSRLGSDPVATLVKTLGIPERCLDAHPSEHEIVAKALKGHTTRLTAELRVAQPKTVVTLGNAALRVLNELVDAGGPRIPKLSSGESYGRPLTVRIDGRACEWVPLAHPAAPAAYQIAHDRWSNQVTPLT